MPCRGPDYYEDNNDINKTLKEEVDRLTKILCDISQQGPTTNLASIFFKVPDFREFVKEHEEVDNDRYYNKYKNRHPNFTKEEIVKMVRSGILDK